MTSKQEMQSINWSVRLVGADQSHDVFVVADPLIGNDQTREIAGYIVRLSIAPLDAVTSRFEIAVTTAAETAWPCFIEWTGQGTPGTAYTFEGSAHEPKVYRQSPHDPADHAVDLIKQAMPVVGVKHEDGSILLAVSDAPAFYENFTSQRVDPAEGRVALRSGDDGDRTGNAQTIKSRILSHYRSGEQQLSGLFVRAEAGDLKSLRATLFGAVARRWSPAPVAGMGAVAFASNYMHLRVNETGHSAYWICPGIEYANKQYTRDAFWQSLILPSKFAAECYRNEINARTDGAERPLFVLLWSFLSWTRGEAIDREAIADRVDYVERHLQEGWYQAYDVKKNGVQRDFQSWYDLCAFETDDAVTYNQGLAAVALLAAEKMGFPTKKPAALVQRRYRELFDARAGYFPLSRAKPLLAVDVLVGDLLSQFLMNHPLLESEMVHRHFAKVSAVAKTPYGFKVTCLPDGSYAPATAYDAAGFTSSIGQGAVGDYQWGGSWYLYDMLFLIGSALHGAPGAEKLLLWRALLDFERGGTYFECTNTQTGQMLKANQGWNGAVYALCREFVKRGQLNAAIDEGIANASGDARYAPSNAVHLDVAGAGKESAV